METRKVTVIVEVPKMFNETDVRDVFYSLRWKVVSVKDEAAQQSAQRTAGTSAEPAPKGEVGR